MAIFSYVLAQILILTFIPFKYSALIDILFTLVIPLLISIMVFYIAMPKELLETFIVFLTFIIIYSLFDNEMIIYITKLKNDSTIGKIFSVLICMGLIIVIGLKIKKQQKDRF